jgi:hypothetical protein
MKLILKNLVSLMVVFSLILPFNRNFSFSIALAQLNCPSGTHEFNGTCRPDASTANLTAPLKYAADKGTDLLLTVPGHLALLVLQLADYLVWLSGAILNYAVQYSVVDMKENIESANSVNNAWRVIRDVSNMAFIFVLLYAAINTILGRGSDTKGLIVRVVAVGILMNFSLFFTKFVIDISNILAVTFYDAIAPGALTESISGGISNVLMEPLQLTTIYKSVGLLEGRKLFIAGVMGTIFSLIAAFVFFSIAIMFIVRFVALIFVLVLSPIAFISFILPQVSDRRKQWVDTLIGQAFFAPIYFLLTWVVIVISRGVLTGTGNLSSVFLGTQGIAGGTEPPTPSDIGVAVNFLILIALMVTSLVAAKQYAGKAGPAVGQLTGFLTGAAGNLAFGGIGMAGRKTLGYAGNKAAGNLGLQTEARTGTGAKGFAARAGLQLAKTARSATFDPRNAAIPTNVIGQAIEGTAGRTKVGKALGLDEVRIPSIKVGEIAREQAQVNVGKPAAEGFKEQQSARGKRVREEEKAAIDEFRGVQDKTKISEGIEAAKKPAGARTTAEQSTVDGMVDVLKKMSKEQIKSQKASVLAIQEVAEALNQKQVESIEESNNYTAAEVQSIKDARSRRLNDAFAAGTTVHVPASGGAPARNGYEESIRILKKADPSTIARMGVGYNPTDPTTHTKVNLNNPAILELFTPGLLGKLIRQNEFTQEKVDAVRAAVIANGPMAPAGSNLKETFDWITTGRGKDIFV